MSSSSSSAPSCDLGGGFGLRLGGGAEASTSAALITHDAIAAHRAASSASLSSELDDVSAAMERVVSCGAFSLGMATRREGKMAVIKPPRQKKRSRSAASDEGDERGSLAAAADTLAGAYDDVDAYAIAREAKRKQREQGIFIDGLQYGEVDPEAFARALSWCSPRAGETFIDLGSGSGKAVLTAAALHPLSLATGVEILQPLHDAAVRAHARCVAGGGSLRAAAVNFECGDALAHPWTASDIVFVSLTCFTPEQCERVAKDAAHLSPGARILVTTKALESSALRLLRRETIKYGRGTLTFIAYERVL